MQGKVLSIVGVALVSLVGCSREVNTTTSTGNQTGSSAVSTGPQSSDTFILDFSGSLMGGIEFGSHTNLAFTIDTTTPVRKYAFQDMGEIGPGLYGDYDFGSCPIDPNGAADHESKLDAGKPADVLSVDLELLGAQMGPPATVCFSYRDPQGQWHVDSGVTPVTTDGGLRAHLEINKGPIDGLYIATSGASHQLATLIYKVTP